MPDREILQPKNWITREYEDPEYEEQIQSLKERIQLLESRERVLKIFTWIFFGALLFTLLILLLYGFSVGGFSLDTTTINLLAGATIAEVAGLLGTAFTWLYSSRN